VDPRRNLVTIVLTQRIWESSDPPAVHRELLEAAIAAPARRPIAARAVGGSHTRTQRVPSVVG
jgi:hypothetical protein